MSSPISGTAPAPTPRRLDPARAPLRVLIRRRSRARGATARSTSPSSGAAGSTVLTERRFTLPLQALEPMDLDGSGAATAHAAESDGWPPRGRRARHPGAIGAGAHVCLTTPCGDARVPERRAPAVHRFAARVGEGAAARVHARSPHPVTGRAPASRRRVTLAQGAAALLSDAWAVGRAARGERWGFAVLDPGSVRDERGLLLKERSVLDRLARDGLGAAEGFPVPRDVRRASPPGVHGWTAPGDHLFAALSALPAAAPLRRERARPRGASSPRLLCAHRARARRELAAPLWVASRPGTSSASRRCACGSSSRVLPVSAGTGAPAAHPRGKPPISV